MTPEETFALALDPSRILEAQGFTPDPWQRRFLLCPDARILLNCSRGAGKSRTTSALALHTALFQPKSHILLVSRAQRQSLELFKYIKEAYSALKRPIAPVKENETTLELVNGSRIIALPGQEGSIRGYQGIRLLVLDEAARIPDDLYYSVRPMLGVSKGRLVALSTPWGQRGWYWREWMTSKEFTKISAPWTACPRISPEFIEAERKSLGDGWVDQEYTCSFVAMEGLVYSQFEKCVWDLLGISTGNKLVGGIDFGWRNPFAAVWGHLDKDDVLWITGERYMRETPLHEHRDALKAQGPVIWYADPAGADQIAELRSADLKVIRGDNDIRLGIAAITARIRSGRLKVSRGNCPNLIAEAGLYRYPTANERAVFGEKPIDQDNHALAALRYLVSRVDARFMARLRRQAGDAQPKTDQPPAPEEKKKQEERTRDRLSSALKQDLWRDEQVWRDYQ